MSNLTKCFKELLTVGANLERLGAKQAARQVRSITNMRVGNSNVVDLDEVDSHISNLVAFNDVSIVTIAKLNNEYHIQLSNGQTLSFNSDDITSF